MRLSVNNIEKSYDRKIIKNLTCEFQSGKLYVIKGVSGCGKSTLLNIIGGVETEFKGNIQADDEVIDSKQMLSLTGYVFQYSLLLSNITVYENLELVCGDKEKIEKLCELFGVKDLLKKYPEQISGGERQRISIIRALLQNPHILLMDEPTASLDEANSKVLAEEIGKLKSADRIVIVSTHEAYFDEIADEILYLNYGEIIKTCENTVNKTERNRGIDCILQKNNGKKNKTNFLRYNRKRNKQLFRFFGLLPYVVMFLLLVFVSTLQKNFENEYMKMIQKNYPVDAFNIYDFELDEFEYKENVMLYERYVIQENDRMAHYLAPEEESVLAIEGMIEFGQFPEKENEIIINRDLALSLCEGESDFNQIIGDSICFGGKEFVIAGILFSFNDMERGELANGRFLSYVYSDIYYQNIDGKLLFIPYEIIKTMGEPVQTDIKRGVYKGLYHDKEIVEKLRKALVAGKINIFDGEILASKSELNGSIKILVLVLEVCFVIACIFMSSQIQTELFYRRKELGYLQIFGVEKCKVRKLVFAGYFGKMIAALAITIIIYMTFCLVSMLILKRVLWFDLAQICGYIGSMMIFYFLFVYVSVCRFLRKDIVWLITE